MKESCPEKEGHPPAESTEKIVDPFARANSARAYSDCLVLTELTQLGELKCFYGETLDQLGGWPCTFTKGWTGGLAGHPSNKANFFHIYKVRHVF